MGVFLKKNLIAFVFIKNTKKRKTFHYKTDKIKQVHIRPNCALHILKKKMSIPNSSTYKH